MENNRSKGGKARALSLSEKRRKEIAMLGVQKRAENRNLPIATHIGEIVLGDIIIPCAVLPNGDRLLSHDGIGKALTRIPGGKNAKKMTQDQIPFFINHKQVIPYADDNLLSIIKKPIRFKSSKTYSVTNGVPAEALPGICKAWQLARQSGALNDNPAALRVAHQAEILTLGFAQVGVIALVDEATGYQKDRAKNALAEILEKFVAKELQPWVKTFPTEYYEQLFRVWGQKFPPDNVNKRPAFMGTVTNNVIYSRLAPNLLEELKKYVNKYEKKARLHQFLTDDVGHPKLREHLSSIITLLKISKNKEEFMELVDQVHPKYKEIYVEKTDDCV